MATVTAFIRTSAKKTDNVYVRFRLSGGRKIQLFHKSDIEVDPNNWDAKNECIKARVLYEQSKRDTFNKSVADRKALILELFNAEPTKETLSSDWLDQAIDKTKNPERYKTAEDKPKTFFDVFDDYVASYRGTKRMGQHYKSAQRIFQRYELYKRKSQASFTLTFEGLNADILRDFEAFIHEEHNLFEKHPDIYIAVPESRKPKPRGRNRKNKILRYIRTIVRWAIDEKKTSISQFPKFKIEEDIYGTPFYITIEERNNLYNFDLSAAPELAVQRDIFVFQCMVGCRVSDLMSFTNANVIDDVVEYIPRKTKDGRPVTVRVPLNTISREIVARYSDSPGEKLLPFIAKQDYNDDIRKVFGLAGLNRKVTILNPTTGEEEKRSICEKASSHIARRTFIGNLYKKVKDPNLVGALSGHKEGSRAFARYREIDDEIKIDLVKMLE
jgi:hypothetical protein